MKYYLFKFGFTFISALSLSLFAHNMISNATMTENDNWVDATNYISVCKKQSLSGNTAYQYANCNCKYYKKVIMDCLNLDKNKKSSYTVCDQKNNCEKREIPSDSKSCFITRDIHYNYCPTKKIGYISSVNCADNKFLILCSLEN